jgi:hypothetical protein
MPKTLYSVSKELEANALRVEVPMFKIVSDVFDIYK